MRQKRKHKKTFLSLGNTSLDMKGHISLSQLCSWEKWYWLRSLTFLKQAWPLLLPAWRQQRDPADEIFLIPFIMHLSWWHPEVSHSLACTSVRVYRPTALNCCECSVGMSGKVQEWGGMAFQPRSDKSSECSGNAARSSPRKQSSHFGA